MEDILSGTLTVYNHWHGFPIADGIELTQICVAGTDGRWDNPGPAEIRHLRLRLWALGSDSHLYFLNPLNRSWIRLCIFEKDKEQEEDDVLIEAIAAGNDGSLWCIAKDYRIMRRPKRLRISSDLPVNIPEVEEGEMNKTSSLLTVKETWKKVIVQKALMPMSLSIQTDSLVWILDRNLGLFRVTKGSMEENKSNDSNRKSSAQRFDALLKTINSSELLPGYRNEHLSLRQAKMIHKYMIVRVVAPKLRAISCSPGGDLWAITDQGLIVRKENSFEDLIQLDSIELDADWQQNSISHCEFGTKNKKDLKAHSICCTDGITVATSMDGHIFIRNAQHFFLEVLDVDSSAGQFVQHKESYDGFELLSTPEFEEEVIKVTNNVLLSTLISRNLPYSQLPTELLCGSITINSSGCIWGISRDTKAICVLQPRVLELCSVRPEIRVAGAKSGLTQDIISFYRPEELTFLNYFSFGDTAECSQLKHLSFANFELPPQSLSLVGREQKVYADVEFDDPKFREALEAHNPPLLMPARHISLACEITSVEGLVSVLRLIPSSSIYQSLGDVVFPGKYDAELHEAELLQKFRCVHSSVLLPATYCFSEAGQPLWQDKMSIWTVNSKNNAGTPARTVLISANRNQPTGVSPNVFKWKNPKFEVS